MNADASPSSIAVDSCYRRRARGKGINDHEHDLERVTMMATCVRPKGDAIRRIALAAVVDVPLTNGKQKHRLINTKYTATNVSVSALCIVNINPISQSDAFDMHPHSVLVALDTSGMGMLHTCPINYRNADNNKNNHLLEMRECHFGITRRITANGMDAQTHATSQSVSDSPNLQRMTTLSARLESDSIISDTPASSQNNTSHSPTKRPPNKASPKKNGRKRKLSSTAGESTTSSSESIYLVASNLNTSILPSQSPPIVMLLSSSIESEKANAPHFSGLAWSKIPGLEQVHVPLSCILFVSQSTCGPQIWASITTTMKRTMGTEMSESKEECNEGVLLMGFQDGTLRASLVSTEETLSTAHLDAGQATTLFQLSSKEPIKSIQLLPSPSHATSAANTPILICIGALGAMVSLSSAAELPMSNADVPKFRIHHPLEICGGCWTSISCVGYNCLDETADYTNSGDSFPSISLAFIGVNDSKQTFLHQRSIRVSCGTEENNDSADDNDEPKVFRLPIPTRIASSIHASPHQLCTMSKSSASYTFTLASSSGSLALIGLSLSGMTSAHQTIRRNANMSFPTESMGAADKANGANHSRKSNGGPSQRVLTILQKLEVAEARQNKVKTQQVFDSVSRQSKHALQEIWEVTQVAALINKSQVPSLVQLKVEKVNNGVAKCTVTTNDMPLKKQPSAEWFPSVHILQSCIHALSSSLCPASLKNMKPICYRRNVRRDGKLIPIVYGGTSTSYNGCQANADNNGSLGHTMKIDVPMNDFIPVHIYGSMSMVYANSVPDFVRDHLDNTWHRSTSLDGYQDYRARSGNPELLNSTGLAKHAISRRNGRPGCVEFIGVSIPFDIDRTSPFILDMLTHFLTSEDQRSGGESTVQGKAEKHVIHRYQNRSTQQNSQPEYVIPWLKERQLVFTHSASSVDRHDAAKFYCSSSSIRCIRMGPTFSNSKELCLNTGCSGTMAMAIAHTLMQSDSDAVTDSDVGVVEIAVGSNVINPDESMSFLPLIRQGIIRHGLGQHHQYHSNLHRKTHTNLLEMYHTLLTEKRTAKVAKHVRNIADELMASIDKAPGHSCPAELLTTSISLYETLRTMNIAFIMS
ncbi:hypothetical protein ACHAWU_009717 [Discostella pseudostelligera]|uniref:Anaphase-promoting complex subunit 1 n=1 Tax=Discostella pseudostelligera TaxID=259834 RepID=A0ABD3MRR0_9STRA